jgi:16S rRNA (guanine(966)-N(2))-methyltransferase RsmD
VINLLAFELPGSRWLDLCCGSGVMACEALQRGAREVVAIERDRRVAAIARHNLELVAASLQGPDGIPAVRIIEADARRWLSTGGPLSGGQDPFDLIYLDPPWPAGLHGPISEAVARGGWLNPGGKLIWECPSDQMPDIPESWTLIDQRRYGSSTVALLTAS